MRNSSSARSPHQAQDHIVAERKRREKISQQFIALSALIPGLKKIDKASVLGDTIQHIKQLQEQVKLLEEQSKRINAESVVYVDKSKSEDVSDTSSNNVSLPEIEARVLENKVLIRIHCEKQEGVLMNILREIDNLDLTVINSSTLHFGASKLDITIIAEMDDEFKLSVKELARKLRVGLLQLM
ncbi:transcription factor bHLH18-like [Lotus japonicus]|uniref:transcription factor bHLH18-like n=1 Tax=Lotus japonicus TaxID=34305 RepID=UPI0025861802|nr:transcription factor bHLH18-like [Lotus japonicus]